jgi:hypothetical protein
MKTWAIALATAVIGTSASALTVPPGSTAGIQITGGYEVVGGGNVMAGSVLEITQVSFPGGASDPFVSSLNATGLTDFEGLALNDLTGDFVGDTITIDLGTVPTFAFDLLASGPGGVTETVVATSKVNTTTTSIPAASGDDTKIEGEATIGGIAGSWSFSISGDNPTGSFTLFLAVPPDLEPVSSVPLPAGAWLLLSGLGAAAFVRRKRA